jgi:hypothetical protein
MNAEKYMAAIVRGAGVVCLIGAAFQLYGMLHLLWERRDALDSVGGYAQAISMVAGFILCGILLCLFGGRLGVWLCKAPPKRRRLAHPAPAPSLHDEGEP